MQNYTRRCTLNRDLAQKKLAIELSHYWVFILSVITWA